MRGQPLVQMNNKLSGSETLPTIRVLSAGILVKAPYGAIAGSRNRRSNPRVITTE